MASVPSVVLDKIDAVVIAAADCVLTDLAEAKTTTGRGLALDGFQKFASSVAMLTGVILPEAPDAPPA